MAAAVADYTPAQTSAHKLVKDAETMTMRLVRTKDILGDLGRRRGTSGRPVLVGFAAETGNPLERARAKLDRKQVDLIVANDVTTPGAGFEADMNEVVLVTPGGAEPVPLQSKARVAAVILDRVESLLAARQPVDRHRA